MGFGDIELFNLALLAKQAWRILQDPDTLSARVLKAVCFPNSEFLEAEVGSSSSKIWRSIVEGRDVLNRGLIKRIGTGESANIWSTNWLPRDGMLRPVGCQSTNPPQMVSELIDEASASWNRVKLQELFTPMDMEVIVNIPISTRRQEYSGLGTRARRVPSQFGQHI
jgi:hypothetical protein